jgi:hypothetical protein
MERGDDTNEIADMNVQKERGNKKDERKNTKR